MTPNSTERAQAESLCGEYVTSFIAREGSFFPCALDKGHEGGHRAGGNCYKHGRYLSEVGAVPACPQWPDCINPPLAVQTPSLGTCGAPMKEESGRPGWIQELRRLAENALGDPHKIVPRMEIPICALNARATPVHILDLIDQLAAAEKRVAELEHTNHTSIDLFAQELGKRLAAEERCAVLADKVLKRGCGCCSNHEDDWHAESCPIPLARQALQQKET